MSPAELVEFFGTQRAVAEALSTLQKTAQPTVAGWVKNGKVPRGRQAQAHLLTGLPVDPLDSALAAERK